MARQTGVTINGVQFSSKDKAKKHISGILGMYKNGQRLHFDHESFMRSVLDFHPDRERKIGAGVAYIFVKRAETFWSKGFCVKRVDGSEDMFSFLECLSPYTKLSKIKSAMRNAVRTDINIFRVRAFFDGMVCPINGERLDVNTCHVDHIPPVTFAKIAKDFIDSEGLDIDAVELDSGNGVEGDYFIDSSLEQRFIDYHNSVARLRLLSKAGNMEVARMVKDGEL
jgi:hypothetical protein